MNRSEFNPLMGHLISCFPNARKSPEVIGAYWVECRGMDATLFARVVQTCVRENTFMPSVGEVICMAEQRLTHERQDEWEKAYRQMKARDSYATEADLVGFEPRNLISLEDWNRLGGEKPKAIEKPHPLPLGHVNFPANSSGMPDDDDKGPPLTPEQAQPYIDAIQKKLGGVRPNA